MLQFDGRRDLIVFGFNQFDDVGRVVAQNAGGAALDQFNQLLVSVRLVFGDRKDNVDCVLFDLGVRVVWVSGPFMEKRSGSTDLCIDLRDRWIVLVFAFGVFAILVQMTVAIVWLHDASLLEMKSKCDNQSS